MTRKLPIVSAVTTALVVVGALISIPAQAAYSWTFSSCTNGSTSNAWGNTCTVSTSNQTGGPTLDAQAWANTGGTSTSPTYALETAHAQYYSGNGVGVNNRDGYNSGDPGDDLSNVPEHAADNNLRVDSLLLHFGSAVQVTSLISGWPDTGSAYDTDFVLMRYTGSGDPSTSFANKTYANLLTQSWEVIGHYSFNKDETATDVSSATANKTSSYWLVAADTTVGTSLKLDSNTDYFKLKTVGAATPTSSGSGSVPEPGSLALLGLGSLLLVRARAKS